MNNPKDYTNHSGGAKGADFEWDKIGRLYGVEAHIHWRPEHLKSITKEGEAQMLHDVKLAATRLGRPTSFKGIELVQRNWLQVHHAEAIFAISYIINPGEKDFKGFMNKTEKQIVSGGTGWAVEMAIQKYKPTDVFDMTTNQWYCWVSAECKFVLRDIPVLTEKFAGIGSRFLTPQGIQAIVDVYNKTFK